MRTVRQVNCSKSEELLYCEPVVPIDKTCEMQLIAACAPVGGDKGTTAQCDACVKKHKVRVPTLARLRR